MKMQIPSESVSNIGRALWIGLKIAIVIQFALEATSVVYQGF
ncbi:MAG: hypothetical protein QMC73_08780 [Myxococcota bacterium]|jgi:hypothetical protein